MAQVISHLILSAGIIISALFLSDSLHDLAEASLLTAHATCIHEYHKMEAEGTSDPADWNVCLNIGDRLFSK